MQIIEKPWGREILIEKNDKYVVKQLEMTKGHRCSLQYHEKKTETFYVVKGLLKVLIGDKVESLTERVFKPGEALTLLPFKIHRMEAIEDCVYLEASTIELDDVVRLKDDYKRTAEAS